MGLCRKEMEGSMVLLCSTCHRFIHAKLSEKELEQNYSSIEDLLSNPEIRRFVEWIRKRPPEVSFRVRKRS